MVYCTQYGKCTIKVSMGGAGVVTPARSPSPRNNFCLYSPLLSCSRRDSLTPHHSTSNIFHSSCSIKTEHYRAEVFLHGLNGTCFKIKIFTISILYLWRSDHWSDVVFVLVLATDVPFIACVINSSSIFVYNLDLSNFLLQSGFSYFWVLSVCLLLVSFVCAAGCHCFDSYW